MNFFPSLILSLSFALFADGTHTAALETFESHLSELEWQSFCPSAGGGVFELVPSTRAASEPFGLFAAHRFQVSRHRVKVCHAPSPLSLPYYKLKLVYVCVCVFGI